MEIFGQIEKWLADKTKFAAVNILRKFEIPCAPVLDMKDLAYDHDLRESGTIVEVPHKQRGTYLTVGSPMKFSAFKPEITFSPLLDEHTNEVLAELGYSAEQIAKFHEAKIVGTLPPEPGEHGWHDTIHAAAALLIGIGIARAIHAAVSGRPGGVYIDLTAAALSATLDAETGRKSLVKVVDPAPRHIPAPEAITRAIAFWGMPSGRLSFSEKGRHTRRRMRISVGLSRAPASRSCQCPWRRAYCPTIIRSRQQRPAPLPSAKRTSSC